MPGSNEPYSTTRNNSNLTLIDAEAQTLDGRATLVEGRATALEGRATALEARSIARPADLDALAALSTSGLFYGDLARVQEGGAYFSWSGSAWQQVTVAKFASTAARDTAYAKASGAYLVAGIRALVGSVEYVYLTAWRKTSLPNRVFPSTATNGAVDSDGVVTSTAQSFVRVRDAFPAGFTVFRCIFDIEASGATGPTFVLAAGATDAASGYDNERQQTIASATTAPAQTLNVASAELSAIGVAGARHVGEVLITSPNVATQTFWDANSVVSLAAGMTTSLGKVTSGGMHRTATAYDSIRLQVAAGTLTVNRFVVEGVV